jgi:hypothetical protein
MKVGPITLRVHTRAMTLAELETEEVDLMEQILQLGDLVTRLREVRGEIAGRKGPFAGGRPTAAGTPQALLGCHNPAKG